MQLNLSEETVYIRHQEVFTIQSKHITYCQIIYLQTSRACLFKTKSTKTSKEPVIQIFKNLTQS